MNGRYQVRVRGDQAISCGTAPDAEHWAELLGTEYAPATVIDTHSGGLLDALDLADELTDRDLGARDARDARDADLRKDE